ncbi:hypothetical protein THASP1DRAFT_33437 [Thamnocephalis sphaerospora]|uniref:Uncharacterized protein n=1 Tax=Thamnocephalis sphaerospora TaxID=78915 RepID=A0A4P9XGN7_9FUNG|nr:hypothetical protein THASP1DRAFT_33437 [Thamnocephalis sphaerospora]|eukprot:RKP04758.1 hypothetical protein THASP1DRAFT_33437 [Thamnocephalis sphaerospora]
MNCFRIPQLKPLVHDDANDRAHSKDPVAAWSQRGSEQRWRKARLLVQLAEIKNAATDDLAGETVRASVSDRYHLMDCEFEPACMEAYQTRHDAPFTSLQGAVLSILNYRVQWQMLEGAVTAILLVQDFILYAESTSGSIYGRPLHISKDRSMAGPLKWAQEGLGAAAATDLVMATTPKAECGYKEVGSAAQREPATNDKLDQQHGIWKELDLDDDANCIISSEQVMLLERIPGWSNSQQTSADVATGDFGMPDMSRLRIAENLTQRWAHTYLSAQHEGAMDVDDTAYEVCSFGENGAAILLEWIRDRQLVRYAPQKAIALLEPATIAPQVAAEIVTHMGHTMPTMLKDKMDVDEPQNADGDIETTPNDNDYASPMYRSGGIAHGIQPIGDRRATIGSRNNFST